MVNVSARLSSAHLSPNATRALFEARGEILTVPAEKGDPRIITHTPRRHGAIPVLVAGRQDDRVFLRRIRRIRAAPRAAERRSAT